MKVAGKSGITLMNLCDAVNKSPSVVKDEIDTLQEKGYTIQIKEDDRVLVPRVPCTFR